jgi:hypothetical protein
LSTLSGGDFVAARSALTSSGAITRKKHLLLDFPGLENMKVNWIGAALVFLRLTQVFKGKRPFHPREPRKLGHLS